MMYLKSFLIAIAVFVVAGLMAHYPMTILVTLFLAAFGIVWFLAYEVLRCARNARR